MTVSKGDVVFVRSNDFHHNELPGIVVSPGGNCADVLVLASGHPPFLMENLKEIDYWDDPVGFYQTDKPYVYRPVPPKEEVNADAPEELSEGGESESDSEGDGIGLVSSSEEETEEPESDGESESEEESEEVDESEANEKASEDSSDTDSERPVAKRASRAPARRKR